MIQDLLVTVFVPVFNGVKYLDETLLSIREQTYANIEVLLVDDSSTDGSKSILEKFASLDCRFKLYQKKNGGSVAHSWNFIMPHIKGDFVFYASQDDIFSPDLIEKMVQRQQQTQADIVVPDMVFYFENKPDNKQLIGMHGDRTVELTGKQACIASLNWDIHGFVLTKTNLITSEFFPEDAFDSDEYITRKVFLKSAKVVFSEGIFFYRQDNTAAITKRFSTKNFYSLHTAFKLFNLLKTNGFDAEVVFDSQYALLRKYSYLMTKFERYQFESEVGKTEVALFLKDFKQHYLTDAVYFDNIGHAITRLQWKYLLLVAVFKTPLLFGLFKRYKRNYSKK